jgi:hypothetical protein
MRYILRAALVCARAALLFALARPAFAQSGPPAAIPADVESIDAIISALYASISGPAGAERQWDRFRSLMSPGARLIPSGVKRDSTTTIRVMTAEEYISANDAGLRRGFFEKEIARKMDRYGNIAQLFSTYESRRAETDAQPFARGINSIQLHFDGKRWRILTIFWEGESPLHPLPDEYLPRR